MALDPIYIALPELEDFQALGGEDATGGCGSGRARPASPVGARASIAAMRALKARWLRRAYERFRQAELKAGNARGQRFASVQRERGMVARRLRAVSGAPQTPSLQAVVGMARAAGRARRRRACARAANELRVEIDYRKYVQWIAAEQWAAARDRAQPLQVFGDVPFMISGRQPGRVDAAGRVPVRRDRRRAARCVQRNRAGLGLAAVALGGDGAERLRVDAAPGPAHREPVRRLPSRSSRRPVSHLHPPARADRRAVLRARRRARSCSSASGS